MFGALGLWQWFAVAVALVALATIAIAWAAIGVTRNNSVQRRRKELQHFTSQRELSQEELDSLLSVLINSKKHESQ